MATNFQLGAIASAARVAGGGGTPPTLLAFNPAASHTTSPFITYSDSNRAIDIFLNVGARYNNFVADYCPAVLTGKRYFELAPSSVNIGTYALLGVVAHDAVWPIDTNAWSSVWGMVAWMPGALTLYSTSTTGTSTTDTTTLPGVQGDVWGVVVDFDAWVVSFYVNGTLVGTMIPAFSKRAVFPTLFSDRDQITATIHGAASDIVLSPPAGASAWVS